MKNLNLSKYGFKRVPEEDFIIDNTTYTCYKVGCVLVTKLIKDDTLSIECFIIRSKLLYEEYSKLPHFKGLENLKGVKLSKLKKEDIQKFYSDCKAFDKEYTEAELKSTTPSYAEVVEALSKIREIRRKEYNDILSRINVPMVCKLETFDFEDFKDDFNALKYQAELNIEIVAMKILGTTYSKNVVDPNNIIKESKHSFYYKELLEFFGLAE